MQMSRKSVAAVHRLPQVEVEVSEEVLLELRLNRGGGIPEDGLEILETQEDEGKVVRLQTLGHKKRVCADPIGGTGGVHRLLRDG